MVDEVGGFWSNIVGDHKGRGRNRGLAGVGSLPRENEAVGATSLEELNSEFMQPFGQVDRARAFAHAVHTVIGRQRLAVDPKL